MDRSRRATDWVNSYHSRSIFIFSIMYQLAFNTDAASLMIPTGHVALARTASLNLVASDCWSGFATRPDRVWDSVPRTSKHVSSRNPTRGNSLSDPKHAVQTIKRFRTQPEIGSRLRPSLLSLPQCRG